MIDAKYFVLLAAIRDEGSLSGAARALGYSQPAITQQLHALERQLGTPVMVRDRGAVAFTEVGHALLRHGGAIVRAISLAETEVRAIAGLRAGRIRLASFPSAAATLIPRALGSLRSAHPGLRFTLDEAETEGALEALRSGRCDLAIVYHYVTAGRKEPEGLALEAGECATTLVEEAVFVAMPVDHPEASSRWVDIAKLRSDTWIAGCPVCRRNLLEACAHAGFDPDIGFETDDYVALQGLVAAGMGVAFVPELMLVAAPQREGVVLRATAPMTKRIVSVVTREALLTVPGVAQTRAALVHAGSRLTFAPADSL